MSNFLGSHDFYDTRLAPFMQPRDTPMAYYSPGGLATEQDSIPRGKQRATNISFLMAGEPVREGQQAWFCDVYPRSTGCMYVASFVGQLPSFVSLSSCGMHRSTQQEVLAHARRLITMERVLSISTWQRCRLRPSAERRVKDLLKYRRGSCRLGL